jgi:hypothetical protein
MLRGAIKVDPLMQLSGDLFKQIITQLKSALAATDRRDGPRVGLRNRVKLAMLSGSGVRTACSIEVGVKDLSPGGIALIHHTAIPPDTIFAIRLPLQEAGDLTVVYKVKNCRPLEKGVYRIGAVLIKAEEAMIPTKADGTAALVAIIATK